MSIQFEKIQTLQNEVNNFMEKKEKHERNEEILHNLFEKEIIDESGEVLGNNS